MATITFYEAFEEEQAALRAALPVDLEVSFTDRTIQECPPTDHPADIISIRTQSVIPADWATRLRAILTRSTGYDHITAYRKTTGIDVPAGYLPKYCARAVAEQAALLWMALLRKLPQQLEQFRRFHRDGLTGRECLERRLLVIGVGNIGREIVRLGRALGMDVRGVDIDPRHEDVDYVDLNEGLTWAEIVVCAMNLTEQNRGLLDAERLSHTEPGTLFVNIARGELSPPGDLLVLLRSGHLGGVALDVYDQESALAVALRTGQSSHVPEVRAVLELAREPMALLTPHNAFNTTESVQRKAEQSVQQLLSFIRDGRFLWPVA